jgi:hypothetical protein
MRKSRTILLPGLLVLAFTVADRAYASGNVLLPSAGEWLSNKLGLTPHDDSSDSKAAPAAVPPTDTTTTNTLPNMSPAETPSTQPTTPDLNTAAGAASIPFAPLPSASGAVIATASGYKIPTNVIMTPDNSIIMAANDSMLSKSVSIDYTDKSIWSSSDLDTINQKLGIPTNDIPKVCHLAFSGFVSTDKGVYMINDTKGTPHVAVKYDGHIRNFMLQSRALCDLVPLGPYQGYVTQLADKYVVPLNPIRTPPPTTQVQQVLVLYTGDTNTTKVWLQ